MFPHVLLALVDNIVDGLLEFVNVLVQLFVVLLLGVGEDVVIGEALVVGVDFGHGERDQVGDGQDVELRLADEVVLIDEISHSVQADGGGRNGEIFVRWGVEVVAAAGGGVVVEI